ncbi:MAG: helicase-exonuclease AddAB subunit AddA [Acutalibacteraceae bacterium]|nr:helicase-exonuclease AddAB subunit AddA [Acutalibacteraceae bacterium]
MKLELTKQQQAAIDEQGSILVSAAAGSGKTAVLVRRIIKALTRKENPVRADRILVVTFTNSAAAEMRARLEKGINDYCAENPDDKAAFKQKLLLQSASICTIDSYCISLVRDNFQKAGVAIDFKIAEENELEAIKEKAIAGVFERYFATNDKTFVALLDAFGAIYDEKSLSDAIKSIGEVGMNMPFPEVWLEKMRNRYESGSFAFWRSEAISEAGVYLGRAVRYINAAEKYLSADESVKSAYGPSMESAGNRTEKIERVLKNGEWDNAYGLLNAFAFDSFSSLKNSKENKNAVCVAQLRDFAKAQLEKAASLIYECEQTVQKHYETTAPLSALMFVIAKEYYEELEAMLFKKGIYSFSHIEHKAFELLCEYKNDEIMLKDGAEEFINQYDEIFVDEYQDVNDLQDKFFYYLADKGKHLFVVGDVKQSIYGFRGANPENFLSKQNTAVDYREAKDNEIKSIILDANFRSKAGICDSINFMFDRIMTKQFCGIDYSATERLTPKATFPELSIPSAEFHLIDTKGENEKNAEASYIADYILKVMNSGKVIRDKETGELRNARFSDFAVLVRYLKPVSKALVSEFIKRKIPVSYTKEGFLEAREIKIMLSLLSVIDNPTLEIELLSVLMSPFFRFTPDDVARVRIKSRKTNLYSAVVSAAEDGNEKCLNFLKIIGDFRKYSAVMPLSKLITHIYDVTDFTDVAALMSDCQSRIANLNYLVRLASDFEASGNYGIAAFREHLIRLGDGKLKGAVMNGGADSVQLVTVHYSKGLQFPVCIFAFTGSGFNNKDQRKSLIIDTDYGISFKYYDEAEGGIVPIDKKLLSAFLKKKQLKEELRMFYVAATRAEDRLVITAAKKNPEAVLSKLSSKLSAADDGITEDIYSTANCYADWIIPCMLLHPDGQSLRKTADYEMETEQKNQMLITIGENKEAVESVEERIQTVNDNAVDSICERLDYKYPFEELRNVQSKAAVSVLAKGEQTQAQYDFTALPAFLSSTGLTPAQRGTAVHKIMQYMDFAAAKTDFQKEIERLCEWEYITEAEAQVDTLHIRNFVESELFDRITASKDLRREMKFLSFTSADKIQPDLPEHLKNEKIVIQGAVDCVFVEDDGAVVVDFKTDRVKREKQLIDSYAMQLDIYAQACEKILDMPVKEKIIYSLVLDKCIVV